MEKETKKQEKAEITREKMTETVLFYLKAGLKRDLILLLFPGLPAAFLIFLLAPKPVGIAAFALWALVILFCFVFYSRRVKSVREKGLTVRKELVREIVPGKNETVFRAGPYSFSVGKDVPAEDVTVGSAYYLVFLNEKTKHVFLYYKAKQYHVQ